MRRRARIGASRSRVSWSPRSVTALYLLPLFWMVLTSVKPPSEIIQKPPVLITTSPQIESYKSILGLPNDRPELYVSTIAYLKNSIVIATATMALTLLLAIPAAYALARFRLRGARLIILAVLVAQMLPSALLVMPLFVTVRSVGLYGSQLAVIIADTALALPLGIILLQTSFRQVPVRGRGGRVGRRGIALDDPRRGRRAARAAGARGRRGVLVPHGVGRVRVRALVPARRREPADSRSGSSSSWACTRRSGTR